MKFIRKIDLVGLQSNHPNIYKLERMTSELINPGASIFRVALYKTRVLIECAYLSLTLMRYFKNLKALKNISQNKYDREALLIGNGPSAALLDINFLKDLQIKHNLEIMGMNFCTDYCKKNDLLPDYIVLSDPYFINEPNDERVVQLVTWINENRSITLFMPMQWEDKFHKNFLLKNSIFYFNDLNLRGWTKNINPLKPRGYTSMTAYKSISILSFLGYKKINIIGIDNSFYLKFSVDQENTLWQESVHSSENYHKKTSISNQFPRGTVDYFYSLSNCFLDLQLFKSLPIVNLDSNSITDIFKKEPSSMIRNTPRQAL
jgi:hypothetical protein